MPVLGAETVVKNIVKFGGGFLKSVNKGMRQVQFLLDQTVTRNISLTDHTLEDLARLGHPYAQSGPQSLHDPQYQVHRQSGTLLASKYSGIVEASVDSGQLNASAYVGVSDSLDYAWFVIYGTIQMVPRDFLLGSLNEVRSECIEILRGPLNKAVISFAGEKVQL